MTHYVNKDVLIAEIKRRKELVSDPILSGDDLMIGERNAFFNLLSFIDTLEVKEVYSYNNGWIDCTKQMPPETKQTSDTLQGYREWTESERVLIWDSMYGCSVDCTKNGKWMSEQRGGYTGQVVHGIIAWRPIPEFSEELLLKAQKGE